MLKNSLNKIELIQIKTLEKYKPQSCSATTSPRETIRKLVRSEKKKNPSEKKNFQHM